MSYLPKERTYSKRTTRNVSQVLLVSVQGNTIATEYNNLSKYIMHILLDSSILLLRSYPDTCEDVYTSILIAVLFVSLKNPNSPYVYQQGSD